jgi:hypothetical protein
MERFVKRCRVAIQVPGTFDENPWLKKRQIGQAFEF